jgi:hypothetical protein
MKKAKLSAGQYILTGNMDGALVQYQIECIGGAWSIVRLYGAGPEFKMAYRTKRECVCLIGAYMD